jgi:hypothetical protein
VFLSAVRAILRVFTSALKGEPDIAGALGSVGRAAFDPNPTKSGLKSRSAAVSGDDLA